MNNKAIRVLHVIHSLGCGGAEMMIMNLYRNIDKNIVQFDFMVHSPDKGFFEDEVIANGGRIFRVPYFNGLNKKQYSSSLRKLYGEHPEIKIVHGHLGSCAHIYLDVANQMGMFTIAHSHNTNSKSITLHNIAYRLFTLKTRNIADYYFACSIKAGNDRFGKKITSNKKIYKVFNNAIDCSRFAYNEQVRESIRKELGLTNKFVIGHVGRFNEQKNHTFLVDIFEKYKFCHDNSILLLIGDGELKQEIESKVNKLNLNNFVMFLGVKDNVNELLQAFDCMLFPSKYEGLPVTLIEAQASGCPCIISDNITEEVVFSDLITQVSLKSDLNKWCSSIEKTINLKRKDRLIELKNNGYDIKDTSKWLENFYIEHV